MPKLDPTLTAPQMAIKWKRQYGRHVSTDGCWVLWRSSRDRKRPQWTVFEVGIGVIDIESSFADAKQNVETRRTIRAKRNLSEHATESDTASGAFSQKSSSSSSSSSSFAAEGESGGKA